MPTYLDCSNYSIMLKFFNHINVGYWNIHGVLDSVNNYHDNKVLDPDFSEIIKILICSVYQRLMLAQILACIYQVTNQL